MSVPVDASQLEAHRVVLTGHCYRMLGSPVDADDAVQETMLRARTSLERFDSRSELRTWLHRIATNVCLDTLAAVTAERRHRVRSIDEFPAGRIDNPGSAGVRRTADWRGGGTIDAEFETRPCTHWLEPVPEARVIPGDATPAERAVLRQSIRLAFVAALQRLPPRPRAALLLTEVVGWSVAEVATTLDTSVAAVNSALQRARATLSIGALHEPTPALTPAQKVMVDRYFAAFERYDVDELVSLLTHDATLSMPPYTMWLCGRDQIRAWLLGPGAGCRGSRLIPVAASGAPAFAQYRDRGATAWALVVLDVEDGQLAGMTSFLDVETLFPRFGLPLTI